MSDWPEGWHVSADGYIRRGPVIVADVDGGAFTPEDEKLAAELVRAANVAPKLAEALRKVCDALENASLTIGDHQAGRALLLVRESRNLLYEWNAQ